MAQSVIFELLKRRRLSGDEEFYTAEQIRLMLKDQGYIIEKPSLYKNLRALRMFGYLEFSVLKNHRKSVPIGYNNLVYRIRKDYI